MRVVDNVRAGSIEVLVDEQAKPLFSAVDHTFPCGQIGIGSFDETGDFNDVDFFSDDAGSEALSRPASAP